jgi:hypothetical protein
VAKQSRVPKTVKYSPPKRFTLDFSDPAIVQLVEGLPQGIVAVLANENARYTSFHAAMASLVLPYGSRISFHTGCYVVDSSNRAVMGMNKDEDWIMLMGDDHVFPPQLAIKLLALMYKHDLDIIVPLCFKRSFPPAPVLYDLGSDNLPYHIDLNDHPNGGLIEVYCAGTAGMIIRKRVIDKMREEGDVPYFQLGGEHWGEDLDFCRRARSHGFVVSADLDMPLGHIVNTTLWPTRQPQGWGCEYEFNQQGGFFLNL